MPPRLGEKFCSGTEGLDSDFGSMPWEILLEYNCEKY